MEALHTYPEPTTAEIALSNQLASEIAASIALDKPTAADVAAWAADREAERHSTMLLRTWINGSTVPDEVRELAVARQAVALLVLVAEHEEEVRTLFRAKAWRRKGGHA